MDRLIFACRFAAAAFVLYKLMFFSLLVLRNWPVYNEMLMIL